MAHARQTIREAVGTILALTPVTWNSVVESRIASNRQIWPYLMTFVESESSEASTVNTPTVYQRILLLTIIGMLKLPGTGETTTIEDKMEALALEVETKLTQATLRAIVPLVHRLEMMSATMDVVIDPDGSDHGEIVLRYQVGYATLEGVSATLI